MRWSGTSPTSPAPRPIRTTSAPATNRQSSTANALGSRGAQFRAAEMQRGTPAQRSARDSDPDKDDNEDDDREPLFSKDDDKDDDQDNGTRPDESDSDDNAYDKDDDQDDKDKEIKTAKS